MPEQRTLGFEVSATWTTDEHGVVFTRFDTWRHNERRAYSTDAVREFAARLIEAADTADAEKEQNQAFLRELNFR